MLNSHSRSGFTNVGAAWTGEKAHVGASYGYDDTKYGIPVVEGGMLQLTPRRHALTIRAGAERLTGAFDAFRASVAVRRYQHDELEGEEVGTHFSNDTTELQFMGSHRAVGRMKGSVGGWVLDRAFDAVGAEALSPAVDQNGFAAFAYEEVTWPHVTLQFGGRVDQTNYAPAGEPKRDFTNGSLSTGLLLRPAAADDRLTIAASVAYAARPPALEELFFFGVHPGNFALEVGNPGLESERAFGVDLSLRWRTPRASGRGDVLPATPSATTSSAATWMKRSSKRGSTSSSSASEAASPQVVTSTRTRAVATRKRRSSRSWSLSAPMPLLQGIESHADFQLTATLSAEAGLDFVHGSLKQDNLPLPRIPPLKFRGGLRYQRNALQIGGQVVAAARQDRLSTNETATDGYTLLKLYGSYSFNGGGAVHTITARLDNATNELYRNHLSLIKDFAAGNGEELQSWSTAWVLTIFWSLRQALARAFASVNVSDSFGICVTIGRMIQASANGTSRVSVSDSH